MLPQFIGVNVTVANLWPSAMHCCVFLCERSGFCGKNCL